MSVEIVSFGQTADGRKVDKIVLQQGKMRAELMTLGGGILSLEVPAPDGTQVDVVLGYNSPQTYREISGWMGLLVGRYANRIAGSRFTIDGTEYTLPANEGKTHLHGGPRAFSDQILTPEVVGESSVKFTYRSPDGENGYPGNLTLEATYTLTDNALILDYQAVSDKPTFCNITNHSYFNLNGSGSVLDHLLWIDADAYTPVDEATIPIAEKEPVEGTPFDFRQEKPISRDIGADNHQLHLVGGYDHNYVLNSRGGVNLAARLTGEKSGIVMEVWTDKPGLQVYTGNNLRADHDTKSGQPYTPHMAVCLETQFSSDSPNHPEWRDIVLRPGQRYHYTTEYRFR